MAGSHVMRTSQTCPSCKEKIVHECGRAIGGLDVEAVAYEMKVFLHGAKMAPPVAPGWLAQIEKWYARLATPPTGRAHR